jgi:hypothetical protein
MTDLPKTGRPCSAVLADGSRCGHRAMNGQEEALCSVHAKVNNPGTRGRPRHGFYSRGAPDGFEYLRRVRPEDFVRQGGMAPEEKPFLGVREREMELHPPDAAEVDANVAIAGLVHKMEIVDALIFRAKEHDLDIVNLLAIYLSASSRLGRLVRERYEMSSRENDDLLLLLERVHAELEQPG